jgi:hypothetical protein
MMSGYASYDWSFVRRISAEGEMLERKIFYKLFALV